MVRKFLVTWLAQSDSGVAARLAAVRHIQGPIGWGGYLSSQGF